MRQDSVPRSNYQGGGDWGAGSGYQGSGIRVRGWRRGSLAIAAAGGGRLEVALGIGGDAPVADLGAPGVGQPALGAPAMDGGGGHT